MKSAYEKAMERLERESGPLQTLTDEQKARIAEIDRKYDALIAEKRLAFESGATHTSSPGEHDKMQTELAGAIADLEARREREKEAIWNEAKG
jgi:hypothetical protein